VLIAAAVFTLVSAAVHFYFFVLESLRWTAAQTMGIYGIPTVQDAETTQPLAYTQGFYNLFLGVGAVLGVLLLGVSNPVAGLTLMSFSTACMTLASVVLLAGKWPLGRIALIRGIPALLALVLTLLGA
jgi:putative membrane protein